MLHVNRLGSIDRSRRRFLSAATALAGGAVLHSSPGFALMPDEQHQIETKPDYSLTIATQPIELAPKRIVSVTAYNGQFPGPLLRLKEGVRTKAAPFGFVSGHDFSRAIKG
jgi:FtsP/CotA-like multicopper oxidase with cupredoxin domain